MDNYKIAKPDTEFAYKSASKLNMNAIFENFYKLFEKMLID